MKASIGELSSSYSVHVLTYPGTVCSFSNLSIQLECVFHTFMDTVTISETLVCGHPNLDLFRYTVCVKPILILKVQVVSRSSSSFCEGLGGPSGPFWGLLYRLC